MSVAAPAAAGRELRTIETQIPAPSHAGVGTGNGSGDGSES